MFAASEHIVIMKAWVTATGVAVTHHLRQIELHAQHTTTRILDQSLYRDEVC